MREAERSKLRRDRFGFVFQFGQLVPELTAEENVALPLLLGGVHREEALREARSWFERLDLEGLENHRTGEMSGGQSQRVALARGLVANPDVLFADEPTGSLDSLSGELVMGFLTRSAREQGSTVILVTHEPRVAAYADREVIVRDGEVHSAEACPDDPPRPSPDARKRTEAALRASSPRRRSPSGSVCCWLRGWSNGLHAQTDRGAWLDTAAQASRSTSPLDGLWWLSSTDQFANQEIDRVDVAATGPNAPVPPGITHLPGPGEYYASPALRRFFGSEPATSSATGTRATDRDHRCRGTPVPELVDHRHRPHRAPALASSRCGEVGAIQPTPANCYACQNPIGSGPDLQWILAAVAVFFAAGADFDRDGEPALRHTARAAFAAMRLVGATPRQISVVSAVEAVVAAVAGVSRLRPLLRFPTAALSRAVYRSAIRPGRPLTALDQHHRRRSGRSVRRRRFGRAWRSAGSRGHRSVCDGERCRTRLGSYGSSRCSPASPCSRTSTRLGKPGGHRGPASPAARGLRTPSGGAGSRWTVVHHGRFPTDGEASQLPRHAHRRPPAPRQSQGGLPVHQWARDRPLRGQRADRGAQLHQCRRHQHWRRRRGKLHPRRSVLQFLDDGLPGCRPSAFHPGPGAGRAPHHARRARRDGGPPEPVPSCFGRLVRVGRVRPAGEDPAIGNALRERRWRVSAISFPTSSGTAHTRRSTVWPSAHLSWRGGAVFPLMPSSSPPTGRRLARTGTDHARTGLSLPGMPVAVEALDPSTARLLAMIQDMTDVIIVASLIIAACSLAVNIAAGLGERKRPFSLLRLTGVPIGVLRRSSHLRVRCHSSLSPPCRSWSAWCRRPFISTPRSASPFESPGSNTGRPSWADWLRHWRSSPPRSRSSAG